MKLSSAFNVNRENLRDAPPWVDNLTGPLNLTLGQVTQALAQNLTIGDNVIGAIASITFTTDAAYTTGTFNAVVVPWPFGKSKSPQIVLVGNVTYPSTQPVLLTAVTVAQWDYNFVTPSINIRYISGLANSSTYTVSLLVL